MNAAQQVTCESLCDVRNVKAARGVSGCLKVVLKQIVRRRSGDGNKKLNPTNMNQFLKIEKEALIRFKLLYFCR